MNKRRRQIKKISMKKIGSELKKRRRKKTQEEKRRRGKDRKKEGKEN